MVWLTGTTVITSIILVLAGSFCVLISTHSLVSWFTTGSAVLEYCCSSSGMYSSKYSSILILRTTICSTGVYGLTGIIGYSFVVLLRVDLPSTWYDITPTKFEMKSFFVRSRSNKLCQLCSVLERANLLLHTDLNGRRQRRLLLDRAHTPRWIKIYILMAKILPFCCLLRNLRHEDITIRRSVFEMSSCFSRQDFFCRSRRLFLGFT